MSDPEERRELRERRAATRAARLRDPSTPEAQSRADLHRWVHPNTGEVVENVTDPRQMSGLADRGFRLADRDALVHIIRGPGARARVVPIHARDIERVLQQDGRIRFFEAGRDTPLLERGAERARQQVLEEFGGTAFVMGLADPLSLGLGPLLRSQLDPNAGRTGAEIVEANPDAHLAGTVLSFAPAMLGGGTSAGGRLLGSLGLAGAGRGAGALAARGAASLAARAGLRSATANRLSRIAGVLTEEATVGVGLEGVLAAQQDRPFLAENAAVDAGLGVGFMLGIGGLGAGRAALGARFMRRAEGTPGGQTATEGIRYANDVAEGRHAYADVVEMEQTAAGSGFMAAGFRTIGGQRPEVARALTHRRLREMGEDAPEVMPRAARGLAADVEALTELQRATTTPAFDQSWVGRFADDLAARDAAPAIRAEAADILRHIDETVRGKGSALSTGNRAALDTMRQMVHDLDVLAAGGADASALFTRVVDFKGRLSRAGDDLGNAGPESAAVAHRLRSLAWNEGAWGRDIASMQQIRDFALRDLKDANTAMMAHLGRMARLGDEGRVASPAAIVKRMREGAAGPGMMETIMEAEEAVTQFAAAGGRLARVSGEASGDEMARLAQSALRHMDEGAAHARAARIIRDAEQVETTRHGALSLMGTGIGAGVIGGLMGGPAGAALGALTTLPFAVFGRPVGTLTRFDNLRRGSGAAAARVERGHQRVRKAMADGPISRQNLGRSAARGVQLYYNLDRPEERIAEFMELRRDILEVAAHPELMQDRLAYTTAAYQTLSPELGDAVAYTWVTALQHLLQHMPQPVLHPLTGQPDEGIPPSLEEVSAFSRRYMVVEDPYIVLDRLATGRLHPIEVDTLRSVYPAIFGTLAADVAGIVADVGHERVPYEMHLQLDTLFGFPTHNSLQPGFVAAVQASRQPAAAPQLSALGGRPMSTSQRPPQAVAHTRTRVDTLLR